MFEILNVQIPNNTDSYSFGALLRRKIIHLARELTYLSPCVLEFPQLMLLAGV